MVAGGGSVAAAVRLSGSVDGCRTVDAGRDGAWFCIAERPRYQSTKAPCDTASTSSSHTMDASTPGGTGIPSTRRAVLLPRDLRTGGHSSSARCGSGRPFGSPVAVSAGSATPGGKSLRAQCRQYWAVSLLSVWHPSQTRVSWCGGMAGPGGCQSVQSGCAGDVVRDNPGAPACKGSLAAGLA